MSTSLFNSQLVGANMPCLEWPGNAFQWLNLDLGQGLVQRNSSFGILSNMQQFSGNREVRGIELPNDYDLDWELVWDLTYQLTSSGMAMVNCLHLSNPFLYFGREERWRSYILGAVRFRNLCHWECRSGLPESYVYVCIYVYACLAFRISIS